VPESVIVQGDHPDTGDSRSEAEPLPLQNAALAAASLSALNAKREDRDFRLLPLAAITFGIVVVILGGYEFGLSERLEHLGFWERILSVAIGGLVALTPTYLALRKAKSLSGRTVAALNELSEAEATLRLQSAALTSSANAVAITNRGGRLIWVNPAFTTLTGYTYAEAIGKNPRNLVRSGEQEIAVYEDLWETILSGRVWRGELVNQRKDGSLYTEAQTITPVRGADGVITHFIAIKQDLTERKNSEREVSRLSAHLVRAIELSPAVFYTWKLEKEGFRPVYVSENVERLLGVAVKDASYDWWRQSVHPEDGPRVMAALAGVMKGDGYSIEYRMRHKTGAFIWVHDSNRVVLDSFGSPSELNGVWLDVSERKRSDDALQLFRAQLDQSDDSIEVIDPESGRFLDVNANSLVERGYSRAEFLSLRLFDLDPTIKGSDWPKMAEALRATGAVRGKGRHRRKDGTTFPIEFSAKWVRLDRDYIVTVVRDISVREEADEALIASELRYRRLFETAKDGILILDAGTGMVADVNPFLIERLGFPRERFLGKRIWELGLFEDICANERAFAELQEKKYIRYDDKPLKTSDGRQLDVEFVSNVYLVGDRKVIQCNIRDITERKRSELERREQNEILLNTHEALMVVDRGNKLSLWNHGAEQLFGWTAAEALGRPPEELLGDEYCSVVETLRATVERVGYWNGEMRARTRDGRKLILENRITLVRDAQGQPRARLNFLADITGKKLLEKQLLEAQRLESIGMLAAGIAHDLNNVLAPIMFGAPMLRESLSAPGDLRILDAIEKSTERGAGLVRQILGFAHNTAGDFQPTQMKHVVRGVIGAIELTFPKSIRIEHDISNDLWLVNGDATQIHQVLLNLCINARDAMPKGGTLRISAINRRLDEKEARALPGATQGRWLMLEVSDTGTGIAPEALARVWEPFFTTKGLGKGTGLGLSTVRTIVANHYGFVILDTRVGRGTTFRVFLPVTAEAAAEVADSPKHPEPEGNNELILVAEDDKAVRENLAIILPKHRYRVLMARDGVEAVELFKAHFAEIALVVTDIDMPRMSGAALIGALAKLRPEMPVLTISGLASIDRRGSQLEVAEGLAHSSILKPFTPDAFLGAVRRLLHPPVKS
jgi:PAS domain S-box-containing protein